MFDISLQGFYKYKEELFDFPYSLRCLQESQELSGYYKNFISKYPLCIGIVVLIVMHIYIFFLIDEIHLSTQRVIQKLYLTPYFHNLCSFTFHPFILFFCSFKLKIIFIINIKFYSMSSLKLLEMCLHFVEFSIRLN